MRSSQAACLAHCTDSSVLPTAILLIMSPCAAARKGFILHIMCATRSQMFFHTCKNIRQMLRLDVAVHQQSSFLDTGIWRKLARSILRAGVLEPDIKMAPSKLLIDQTEGVLRIQGGARMASMALFLKWTVVLLLLGAATTSAYTDADFQMRTQMRALKQFGESRPDSICLGLILRHDPSPHLMGCQRLHTHGIAEKL